MTDFYKKPAITKVQFAQDEDTSSSRDGDVEQTLTVETVFVAGGDHADGNPERYWVIETERWAFNSLDELVALLLKAGVEYESKVQQERAA